MPNEEQGNAQPNKAAGCGFIVTAVVNLLVTISIIRHFPGFWYGVGGFLVFGIGGMIGGSLGMAVGIAIAKAQDPDNVAKQLGYAFVALLIGISLADIILGRLVYGLDVLRLM